MYYAQFSQNATYIYSSESAIGFGLVKGDLVRFDLPFEEFGEADVYRGIVMRNGKHGNIPRDVIYVLPTTEEPPANVMVSKHNIIVS
ncbi:hypothetical protein DPMN_132426 [Dreissena polymorpha]|uniref:Uncharacterized protein n=1 Tax=Dreissena polymorpha TaxID=45954 RepID=A0A9D4FRJ5_DREPO|nr:hypothetical protein DPMN_132426 [Dreissena polymorpha]